jgi:hypothetical protein
VLATNWGIWITSPVSFEKAEDDYVLKFKDKDEIFEVPVPWVY